jgi:hypothetical protein
MMRDTLTCPLAWILITTAIFAEPVQPDIKKIRLLVADVIASKKPVIQTPAYVELLEMAGKSDRLVRCAIIEEILAVAAHGEEQTGLAAIVFASHVPHSDSDLTFVGLRNAFSDDSKLRTTCMGLFEANVLHTSARSRWISFAAIADTLSFSDGNSIRESARRYMFQRSPRAAFDVLAFEDKNAIRERSELFIMRDEAEIALARCRQVFGKRDPNEAGFVREAERSLEKLAKRDEWWCKLYVAETLARNDDIFPKPEAFPALKDEKNPLVREALDKPLNGIHYRTKAKNDLR